jgi:integrase
LQALSKSELLSLFRIAKERCEWHWLMFLVTYLHGLRASETTSFERSAVADGYLTIARLKGSRRTVQPLLTHENPLLNEHQALIDYCGQSNFNEPVFKISRWTFRRIFARYCQLAGIPKHKQHPHVLKHSLATHIIDVIGVPLTQAQLGHESGASTLKYAERSQQEAAVATAGALGGSISD